MNSHLGKGFITSFPPPSSPAELRSAQPPAGGGGVILQADNDPSRDGVGPRFPLLAANVQRLCVCGWVCVSGGSGIGCSLGVSLYCASFSSVMTLQACSAHWGERGKGSGGSRSLRCTPCTQTLTQPDEGLLETYSPGLRHSFLLFLCFPLT